MSGVWSSSHSGLSDDEAPLPSTRALDQKLSQLGKRIDRETTVVGMRDICIKLLEIARSSLAQIDDLHHDLQALESRNAILEKDIGEAENALADENTNNERKFNEVQKKYLTALEQIEVLENELLTGHGGGAKGHDSPTEDSFASEDGEEMERVHEPSDNLRSRYDRLAEKYAALEERYAALQRENQALAAAPVPKDVVQQPLNVNSSFDMVTLRRELETIVNQGLTPQLNVHIHQHDHQHVHNHEHQHLYGVKATKALAEEAKGGAETKPKQPTTVTMTTGKGVAEQVKVSLSVPGQGVA